MKGYYLFLFPSLRTPSEYSMILLFFRFAFGVLLMRHGLEKCLHFDELCLHFPNPIGLGVKVSLVLAIFAELFCSFFFILGFLYRLVLIPMLFTLFVATFIAMGHAPFAMQELPFIYFIVFVLLYIAGAGKFSLDYYIHKKLFHDD